VAIIIVAGVAATLAVALTHNTTTTTATTTAVSTATSTATTTVVQTTTASPIQTTSSASATSSSASTNANTTCTPSSPVDDRPIRVGVLTSLTGVYTALGEDQIDATNLVINQVNRDGGIYVKSLGGCSLLQVFYEDEGDDAQTAVAGMTKLIYSDDVDFVVGGVGTADTTPAENINSAAGVPFIITDATGNTLTTRTDINATGDFIFGETTSSAIAGMVNFFIQDLKPTIASHSNLTIGDFVEDNSVGQLATQSLVNDTNGRGADIIDTQTAMATETDVSSSLLALSNANPQVLDIQCCADIGAAEISADRDYAQTSVPLITQNGETTEYYSELTSYLSQTHHDNIFVETQFPAFAVNYSSSVTNFEKQAELVYGRVLGPDAAIQYDAVNLFLEAIEAAGSVDHNAVIHALQTDTFPAGLIPMANNAIKVTGVNDFIGLNLVEQVIYNSTLKAAVPYVVWPSADAQRSINFTGIGSSTTTSTSQLPRLNAAQTTGQDLLIGPSVAEQIATDSTLSAPVFYAATSGTNQDQG
jgi:ABC-type branched-subunit amino acid transport system substrate-binding protein